MARQLTPAESAALNDVAAQVGTTPAILYRLIDFESAWDPAAKNPNSSARGLIQFIDGTAEWLGYQDSADLVNKHPTIEDQLRGPVSEYLGRYGPYDSEYKLFMAVFYPAARTWPPDQQFPEWVTAANPGIRTPADYVNLVHQIRPLSETQIQAAINAGRAIDAGGILLIVGAAVALWYVSQA